SPGKASRSGLFAAYGRNVAQELAMLLIAEVVTHVPQAVRGNQIGSGCHRLRFPGLKRQTGGALCMNNGGNRRLQIHFDNRHKLPTISRLRPHFQPAEVLPFRMPRYTKPKMGQGSEAPRHVSWTSKP